MVLTVLALGILWWLRANSARRAALRELQSLERAAVAPHRKVALLNRLLKRYALASAPTAGTAALTGGRWLEYLDARCGGDDFRHGVGQVLQTFPYGGEDRRPDMAALFELARRWIKCNSERR